MSAAVPVGAHSLVSQQDHYYNEAGDEAPSIPGHQVVVEDEDEGNSSQDQDQDQDGIEDQDGAQAVMQPALSAVASHLTSVRTPAIEKAAALEKLPGGGLFAMPLLGEEDGSGDNEEDSRVRNLHSPISTDPGSPLQRDTFSSPEPTSPLTQSRPTHVPLPRNTLAQNQPLPSPWKSGPKELVINNDSFDKHPNRVHQHQGQPLPRPSKGAMSAALEQSPRHRSRSAGQDALKKLQKAFPSLSTPSHLLPSLPTNFFSAFSDKYTHGAQPARPGQRLAHAPGTVPRSQTIGVTTQNASSQNPQRPSTASRTSSIHSRPSMTPSRPAALRRVTSDDSLLYHSLSRASSLGNDEQFQDVREMVNMRFQAIKESLPDVPNFRMPSLPKLHAPSFISLNSMDGRSQDLSEPPATRSVRIDIDMSNVSRDNLSTLDSVLEELTGDIVVMGGLRGSILRSAKPPHQQVWAPVKVGLNIRKVNLEIGLDDEDEERVEETIIPSGMLSHMGPVDMSRKLFKKLKSCENARNGKLRVWNYGYDWRLSPYILSRKLREFLAKLPSNQPGTPSGSRGAMVIAHSMGGIITRHAVNQDPSLFSGVLFAGTPQRCINILGPLRHGDVVLFNEKLLSPQVNFSIRSYYVFLPEDGFCFVDKETGESYPIDFYDAEQWVKYHICPSAQPALPALNRPPLVSSTSSSFAQYLPNSLRSRAESLSEKRFSVFDSSVVTKDRTIAPQLNPGTGPPTLNPSASDTTLNGDGTVAPVLSDSERKRNIEYLSRTLGRTKKFRSELVHSPAHQSANAYPPFALLYGKSTPTVYAAQVNGREGIACADAYDDLLFRPGDGVVLAKEAMIPEGYSVVKGGRVCTERGHITMLADLSAVGQALGALIKGRKKGIGKGRDV